MVSVHGNSDEQSGSELLKEVELTACKYNFY